MYTERMTRERRPQPERALHRPRRRLPFIDVKTLADAKTLPHTTGQPHTVLLTGANGYLGRFLCLEWLERLSQTGGSLICVVRGGDAATVRTRLEGVFDSGDPELLATQSYCGISTSWLPITSRSSPATSVSPASAWTRRPGTGWPRVWTLSSTQPP
jgi:hypothetical protein